MYKINLVIYVLISIFFSACLGSKKDSTVDQIFEQGKIDPKLVPTSVGYVPMLPFFNGFSHPQDVYVGYDELVYVADEAGLHVLDQSGRKLQVIPVKDVTDIIQDRRLHTYITGTVIIQSGGQPRKVAAVFHLTGTATTGYQFIDTLIHPFCDDSRNGTGFRTTDESVRFTGLACTSDNRLYVARTGPMNTDPVSIPDNAILYYSPDGDYIGYCKGLDVNNAGLKSVRGINSLCGFAAPPQRVFGINSTYDLLYTLDDATLSYEYKALWVRFSNDIDLGEIYTENQNLLFFDTVQAESFLYSSSRFIQPTDIYSGGDQTAYIWVTDAGNNTVNQFTSRGFEGVPPPANSGIKKQVRVSFGGKGSGLMQFDYPSGICSFRKMIYVADKNNNRVSRFKLSTDLE